MGRRTIWALALALMLVSCTARSDEAEPDRAVTSTTVATGPGRLVTLDSSGDIVVVDPDGTDPTPITDDAGVSTFYAQPVWSPDGRLVAWGQATNAGFAVGIQGTETESRTLVETPNLPFYLYWSPNGETLGVLHNGTAGVDFRMVDVEQGTSMTVDSDAPYYFSWSPSGDRVVTHAGENRVESVGPDGDRLSLEPTSSSYLAPHWTPQGVFHVVDDALVIEDDQGERRPIAEVSGFTMFVANPQGTRVALQTTGAGSAISIALKKIPTVVSGSVVVVDLETESATVASPGPSVGFFWSHDGESLLVLTPGSAGIVPRVWDVSGSSVDYAEYAPPGTIVSNMLPFFPQYAQSVDFWSPDSSAFAFAGDLDGEQGIWVQKLGETHPKKVADGTWVAWSSG